MRSSLKREAWTWDWVRQRVDGSWGFYHNNPGSWDSDRLGQDRLDLRGLQISHKIVLGACLQIIVRETKYHMMVHMCPHQRWLWDLECSRM